MITKINIFLTKDEKSQIETKMRHYHVSMSNIAQKVSWAILKAIIQKLTLNEDVKSQILDGYLYPSGNYKTSIKPQDKDTIEQFTQKKSIFYTNCLKIYVNRELKKYFNDDGCQMIQNYINDELQKSKETFYDYNNFCRNSQRYNRENKDYIERMQNVNKC